MDMPLRAYGGGTCSVDDCKRAISARGLCNLHYDRQRRGIPMEGSPPVRKYDPICSVEDCDRPHAAKGFCLAHWRRDKAGLDVSQPIVSKLITDDLLVRLRTYAPEGEPDECWEWTRALNKGYGAIAVHGSKMRMAHVVAWELHNGQPLPEGMLVRHTCDNPPCTNPAHLLIGTHKDNSHDRLERGPAAYNGKGFRHRTPEEVAAMRQLFADGLSMGEIGRRFGCSRTTAARIVKGVNLVDGTHVRSSRAKLTDDQVRAIRNRYASGEVSQQKLADEFGLTQPTVSSIIRGETYQHTY